jgi:hypothetical protein
MTKLTVREVAVMSLSLLFAGIGYIHAENMADAILPSQRQPHVIKASVVPLGDISSYLAQNDFDLLQR